MNWLVGSIYMLMSTALLRHEVKTVTISFTMLNRTNVVNRAYGLNRVDGLRDTYNMMVAHCR